MRLWGVAVAAGLALGLGAGYLIWGLPTNWYGRTLDIPSGEQGDLVRYGQTLILDTARHIGKSAADPAMRYAGNDLACVNCHLNGGLRPFGAPFVSTAATFPMLADNRVVTLKQRVNGCMRRSMNGTELPEDSREMNALLAYFKFLGQGTPEGVRLAGMGLLPLPNPPLPPDVPRGEQVYASQCAGCHKADGQGERRAAPAVGYSIPPLWGDDSFNEGAGMAKLDYAAAYVRANMPFGVRYQDPVLSLQQSWDVAAYMISKPRPPAPPEPSR